MERVPLTTYPSGQRRFGPFWIEEGAWLVVFGATLLAVVAILYILALNLARSS